MNRRIGKHALFGTQQFDPSNPDSSTAALSTVQSAVGLGGSVISPGAGGLNPTPPTPAPLACLRGWALASRGAGLPYPAGGSATAPPCGTA